MIEKVNYKIIPKHSISVEILVNLINSELEGFCNKYNLLYWKLLVKWYLISCGFTDNLSKILKNYKIIKSLLNSNIYTSVLDTYITCLVEITNNR